MKIIKFSAKMNLNNWSKKYWNAEYCQITSTKKKMSSKRCKIFPTFCKMYRNIFLWTLDVEKLRTIILNMAKILERSMKEKKLLMCRWQSCPE